MFWFIFKANFILIAFCLSNSTCFKKDRTLVVKAFGRDVVEAVDYLIKRSGIFPDDHNLLIRLANFWSNFGDNTYTFINRYNIWGINQLEIIKDQSLSSFHAKINKTFGINMLKIELTDLTKPLIGGLAISLYFAKFQPVPVLIEEQCKYIQDNYKNYIAGDCVKEFNNIRLLEKWYCKLDLAIVLDGSSSIETEDFKLAQTFVSQFVSTLSLGNINLAFIVYGDVSQIIFPFDNELTTDKKQSVILNLKFPQGGSNTSGAIQTGTEMFVKEHMDKIPHVMAIFTGGEPDNIDFTTESAEKAANSNISLLAIGVGNGIKQVDLLKMVGNVSNSVFNIISYQHLSESSNMMRAEICKLGQTPIVGQKIEDTLIQKEKLFLCYELPSEGITISVEAKIGKIVGYYSYIYEAPSAALYDGAFVVKAYIPLPKPQYLDTKGKRVCITVEGVEAKNNFTITTEKGNHI